MNQVKRLGSVLALLAVAIVFVSSGPVSAQNGDDDVVNPSTSTTTSSTEPTTPAEQSSSTSGSTKKAESANRSEAIKARNQKRVEEQKAAAEHKTEVEKQKIEDSGDHAELHKKGADMVAEMRKEHKGDKEKTAEQRKKACESHKKGLQTKFAKISGNSTRTQARITSILDKAIVYQQTSGVQATDFDSLVAAAEVAKLVSADSITALLAVTPTVDCNNTSVASDVASFKVAAQSTRTSLKTYRTAVKAVLESLKAAKPAATVDTSAPATTVPTTTTGTDGGNQ